MEDQKPYRYMEIIDTTSIGGDFVLMEGSRILAAGKVQVNKYVAQYKEQIAKLLILAVNKDLSHNLK